jgi:hypothetical protein
MIRLIQTVWISISRTMQKNVYIMLQQSATISRCRVHIWHGCTIPFIKILAFDQNVGNACRCMTVRTRRRLLYMWLMSTSRECQVRNRVTFISSHLMDLRGECTWHGKFHSLQFVASRMRSMHLGHKTETRWAQTFPTARSGDSSLRNSSVLDHCIGSLDEVEYLLQNLDNPMDMRAFMETTKYWGISNTNMTWRWTKRTALQMAQISATKTQNYGQAECRNFDYDAPKWG